MNDIIVITKSLQDFDFRCFTWWSHWKSRTWNEKTKQGFLRALLASLVASLVQPVISLVVKGKKRGGTWREYMNENV